MSSDINTKANFPTAFNAILDKIESLHPVDYGSSRNYGHGALSYLSYSVYRLIAQKMKYDFILIGLDKQKYEQYFLNYKNKTNVI